MIHCDTYVSIYIYIYLHIRQALNTLSVSFDVENKFGMPYTASLAAKGFQTLLTSDVAKFNRISPAQPGSLRCRHWKPFGLCGIDFDYCLDSV